MLSDGQRSVLEKLSRSQTAPQRQVLRAKALLMAAEGQANERIAAAVGVSPTTVRAWRARFAEEGAARLGQVRKGRGPEPSITREQVEQIVHDTLHAKPKGETHWSTRSMARHAGVSRSTVARIWHARGLKPHLVDTFKVSTDPVFEDKLTDVVGLYVNPPENAIVLCAISMPTISTVELTSKQKPEDWSPNSKFSDTPSPSNPQPEQTPDNQIRLHRVASPCPVTIDSRTSQYEMVAAARLVSVNKSPG